jgi:Holliday junction DNA helicase RuvA
VSDKSPINVIIDCNGVGYAVHIPLSTYDKMPAAGHESTLFIHFSMSDNDGIRLFGFATTDERALFRQLISISKIGPKLALAILSALSVDDFIRAVQTQNAGLLATIPGIGKKSAERLIIELKDKVGSIITNATLHPDTPDNAAMLQEAESALITLGYRPADVSKSIASLMQKENFSSAEELVKKVIKTLYGKRLLS